MRRLQYLFILLSALFSVGHLKAQDPRQLTLSFCGSTITNEVTVVASTVLKTCGISPTTALPPCAQTRAADFSEQSPDHQPHRAQSESSEGRHLWGQQRQAQESSNLVGSVRSALKMLAGGCPATTYSVTSVTKTETILSSFTCVDKAASILYPDYPFCDGITMVTCGTVPPGKLASCAPERRSAEVQEDYSPSAVQSIEATALPELTHEKRSEGDHQGRLTPSFNEYAADFLIKQHYSHLFAKPEGRAHDIITQTVPYACQGPQGFLPAVPPCSMAETTLKLNCTIIRGTTDKLEGEFYSPNYPKNYNPDASVCWTIIAPKGYRIQLNIHDFITEKDADFLRIYDGVVPIKSPAPAILSGVGNTDFELPFIFTPTSSSIYLKFYSNSANQLKGFEVDYKFIPL